jgi:hypothetical protein
MMGDVEPQGCIFRFSIVICLTSITSFLVAGGNIGTGLLISINNFLINQALLSHNYCDLLYFMLECL